MDDGTWYGAPVPVMPEDWEDVLNGKASLKYRGLITEEVILPSKYFQLHSLMIADCYTFYNALL